MSGADRIGRIIHLSLKVGDVNGRRPATLHSVHCSLGGGVGTLMAFAVQRHLNAVMPQGAPIVSAALFAPPNVGPPQFTSIYNRLVNGRRIAFQYDVVPQASAAAAGMQVQAFKCQETMRHAHSLLPQHAAHLFLRKL